MSQLRSALVQLLPSGHSLPHENWVRRHGQISLLLWLHVFAVPIFGLTQGLTPQHSLLESLLIGLFAVGASERRLGRNLRAAMATLGLVSASAVLTHMSGGLIEMHFHFFVMVMVVSLYQSWVPFLLALGYVVLHHGIVGAVDPGSVFNHPAALANPWKWALVHGFFVLGQSLACLVAWRVNEDALDRERAAREDLQRANQELAEAQAISNVGSWDWDVSTGDVWWSAELYKLSGRDPEGFTPSFGAVMDLVHPGDRDRVSTVVDAAIARRAHIDCEYRMVRPDGTVRDVHALGRCVTRADGSLAKLIGTCQDITERKVLEQEIQHRALHDSLTGLGNRALFLDRVDHALAVAERSSAPVTVLYLDLDDFKTVNDSLGHGVGDALLVEVSRRLRATARSADTVARLGGDEFAILLEDTDQDAASDVAQRIGLALQAPVFLDGKEVAVRASIGIAPAAPSVKPSDVLRDADIAMYVAKRDGKGGHQVFRSDMLSSVVTRMELQAELKQAIERQEFALDYQPVVNLDTGALEGVEALVRWHHPVRGVVSPADFIPLAEETGLIVPLGAWVTRQAVQQAKTLQDAFGAAVSVNVNLSPQQVLSDVVGMVERALADSGLDPRHLILEITETSLMSDEEAILAQLEALRALGVRIAVDDFGTGYSSLGYLSRLPIDILKIDRSFVACITEGPEQSALAQAIIKLARIFNLRTVAEGIETDKQAEWLRSFGCDSAQGYYFCRPMAAEQLMRDPRWAQPTLRAVPTGPQVEAKTA